MREQRDRGKEGPCWLKMLKSSVCVTSALNFGFGARMGPGRVWGLLGALHRDRTYDKKRGASSTGGKHP